MEFAPLPRKANVLAVDDKRANLLALEAALGAEHNLVFATSGEEAISVLASRRDIDLILLDVQMPALDGFETAARIRQVEAFRNIPIIFVTAVYSEDPFIRKGYEAGGIDYFTKPLDPEILKTKVAVYAAFKLNAETLNQRDLYIRELEERLQADRKPSTPPEGVPVGVLIADVEGRICQTTEEAVRILGSVEPVRADACGEILGAWYGGGEAIKVERGPLATAIQKGEVSDRERVQIQCRDGSVKTIVSSAAPLRGRDGAIAGAVILIQDLTPAKV